MYISRVRLCAENTIQYFCSFKWLQTVGVKFNTVTSCIILAYFGDSSTLPCKHYIPTHLHAKCRVTPVPLSVNFLGATSRSLRFVSPGNSSGQNVSGHHRQSAPRRQLLITIYYNSRPCKTTWDMHYQVFFHFVYFVVRASGAGISVWVESFLFGIPSFAHFAPRIQDWKYLEVLKLDVSTARERSLELGRNSVVQVE